MRHDGFPAVVFPMWVDPAAERIFPGILTARQPITQKEIGGGDEGITYGSTERPKYRAVRQLIDSFYTDIQTTFDRFSSTVTLYSHLNEPSERGRFQLTDYIRETIHLAHRRFMESMIGVGETRRDFSRRVPTDDHPDGQVQQYEQMAYGVGVGRAVEIAGQAATLDTHRMNPDVVALLENAFDRMTMGGRMRIAQVEDEVIGVLAGAQEAGLSPIETARILQSQFDGYNSDFQRLARTEMATASETGLRGQFRDFGVTDVQVLISDGACPTCQAYVGRIIPIDDEGNLPIYHPNCLCSIAPVGYQEEA